MLSRSQHFCLPAVLTALLLGVSLACGQERTIDQELSQAARENKPEKVEELLKQGADPNALEDGRRSVLCEAVGNRNVAVLKQLLDAGAKPDDSAMWQAGWLNREEAVHLLLAAGGDPGPCLAGAAQGGHAKLVKLLLDKGADPNAKPKDWSSPLHGAALQGGLETVEMLLKAGADPNAVAQRGVTPLHQALRGDCDLAVVQSLVKAGAKLDAADQEGFTPVRFAGLLAPPPVYNWLLKASGGKEPRPKSAPSSNASKKSTVELFKDLNAPTEAQRHETYRELAVRGNTVMPDVLAKIEQGTATERFYQLFMVLGPEAEAALPMLTELLDDKERVFMAVRIMNIIKRDGVSQLPLDQREKTAATLYQAAIAKGQVAEYGISMLVGLGDVSAPYVLKLLRSNNRYYQQLAADGLGDAPFANQEIQAELMKLARKSSDISVRLGAIQALGKFGNPDPEIKSLLLDVINQPPSPGAILMSRTDQATNAAARSLSRFGPEIIDDLLPLLSPIDRPERQGAMIALEALGAPGIPRLIELLDHKDEAIATSASVALNRIGKPAVPELAKAVSIESDQVTIQSARALWWIGNSAKEALPALLTVAASKDRSDAARPAVVRATLKVDPESCSSDVVLTSIPVLIRVLDKGSFREQGEAAEALGLIGPTAREALPLLRQRLQPPSPDVGTGKLVRDFVQRHAKAAITAIEKETSKVKIQK